MLLSDLIKLTIKEQMVIEEILDSIFHAGTCEWDGERYPIAYYDFLHSLTKGELKSYKSAVKKLTGNILETNKEIT